MADNISIKDAAAATIVVAAKDVSSVYVPASTPVTPANVTMVGTAGVSAAGVMSVQGIASGTALPISVATIPSHAVTNAGTFAVQATNTPLTNLGAGEYETVAASQTAQALGATGAIGDYISGVLVIPATTTPGVVTLLDNAISIPLFVGGASSVSNLVPFFIPLGMISVSGAWKLTTGANVSCIGIGNFT